MNRHEHFLDKIEQRLTTVAGLTVLKSFDVGKWREAGKFPYAHVYAEDNALSYFNLEDGDYEAELYSLNVTVFVGYEKADSPTKGEMAREALRVCSLVEKALTKFQIPQYKTSGEIAVCHPLRYARQQRSIDDDKAKGLAMVGFVMDYEYETL